MANQNRPKWLSSKFAHNPEMDINETTYRSAFLRDYSSIIHSTHFRRLSSKTQVFSRPNHDHIRSRLSHSQEVAHIGRHLVRLVVRQLAAQKVPMYESFHQELEDLTAGACLAHDLGHPPFGHTGQKILNNLTSNGGQHPGIEFDDNKQVFHILTLETPFISVSASLAAATVKKMRKSHYVEDENAFKSVWSACGLSDCRHPVSYLMEAADDIAYLSADIEDYLRLGGSNEKRFSAILQDSFAKLEAYDNSLEPLGNLANHIYGSGKSPSEDVIATSLLRSFLGHTWNSMKTCLLKVKNIEDLPNVMHEYIVSCANKDLFKEKGETNFLYSDGPSRHSDSDDILKLKTEVFDKCILSIPYIAQQDSIAAEVLGTIWAECSKLNTVDDLRKPFYRMLPRDIQMDIDLVLKPIEPNASLPSLRRQLATFVCGMTDRFAIDFYARLKNPERLRLVA